MAEQSTASSADPAFMVVAHSRRALAGFMAEPVTARLVDHPKLLAAALDQSISQFALRDFQTGVDQSRFQLSMNEQLLDRLLIWGLVGLLIEHATQARDPEELMDRLRHPGAHQSWGIQRRGPQVERKSGSLKDLTLAH